MSELLGILHDMRNLITVSKLCLSLLKTTTMTSLPAKEAEALDEALRAIEALETRLFDLIEEAITDKEPSMHWDINLDSLKRGTHRVETHEGAIREGRITRIDWDEKTVEGRTVRLPTAIELNGEGDLVDWPIVRIITRLSE